MKKLLVVVLMLATASMANATMVITVNGEIDPPDTAITLAPSQSAIIGLNAPTLMGQGSYMLQISPDSIGTGDWDISSAVVLYPGFPSEVRWNDDAELAGDYGLMNPMIEASLTDTVTPIDDVIGQLVDGIIFHCSGMGDVILKLVDNNTGEVLDTQVIHQIPEPMTMVLLGLGGLMLRRRK